MPKEAHRSRDPDETHSRLLRAALTVFGRQGYAQATVDEIVAEAGCSKGAFYNHFVSKEEIVIALLDQRVQYNRRRLLDTCPWQGRAADWLQCLVEHLLRFSQEDTTWPALSVEFMAHGMRGTRIGLQMAKMDQEWRALIAHYLRESEEYRAGQMAASPETVAACIVALLDGFIIQASMAPDQLPTRELHLWLEPLLRAWFSR